MVKMHNLNSLKVTKSTSDKIRMFIYENRSQLSKEMIFFYSDVAGMVDYNARKRKSDRSKVVNMGEILERVYNIEKYILAAGAISYEVVYQAAN